MASDIETVLNEMTPLAGSDCFYVVERSKLDFSYPLHTHLEYELNFVENGAGVKRIVGDSVEIISDYDLVLISGDNLAHHWTGNSSNGNLVREITIQFSSDLLSESLLNRKQFDSIKQMLKFSKMGVSFSMTSIMRVYSLIDKLSLKQGFYAVMDLFSLLYELSLDKECKVLSSSSFASISQSHNSRRVSKICEYIERNYQNEIRLSQLACLVGMTEAGLSRFFKTRTGKILSEHTSDIRNRYARNNLVENTNKFPVVCYECGFNNLSNFNRVFKTKRGLSPKDFRENYRKSKI